MGVTRLQVADFAFENFVTTLKTCTSLLIKDLMIIYTVVLTLLPVTLRVNGFCHDIFFNIYLMYSTVFSQLNAQCVY